VVIEADQVLLREIRQQDVHGLGLAAINRQIGLEGCAALGQGVELVLDDLAGVPIRAIGGQCDQQAWAASRRGRLRRREPGRALEARAGAA